MEEVPNNMNQSYNDQDESASASEYLKTEISNHHPIATSPTTQLSTSASPPSPLQYPEDEPTTAAVELPTIPLQKRKFNNVARKETSEILKTLQMVISRSKPAGISVHNRRVVLAADDDESDEDEDALFCRFIAKRMRKLPEHKRKAVKKTIFDCIMEADSE